MFNVGFPTWFQMGARAQGLRHDLRLMFMLFNIGTGMGPALSGRAFDALHSYSQIFMVYEVALALTCVLLLGLGKHAYPPVKHAPQPA
jgi:predicted MFS family arabinose efflux permease